jgi:probable phosphoglycerate mutase
MNTTLIIARHGNTFAAGDVVRRVGITDLPLVESGITQARSLAQHFMAQHIVPDVLFTSQLQRTKQMAEIMRQHRGISITTHENPLFNEIDYGVDENQPEEQVVARIGNAALKQWEEDAIPPSGWHCNPAAIIQGWQDFAQHIVQDYAGKTICVFTSNGIARFAPAILEGGMTQFAAHFPLKLATGAYGIFTHKKGSTAWHCLSWNIKP